MSTVPEPLLSILKEIEPDASHFKSQGYCVRSSNGNAYFAKLGEPEEEERYVGEAKSVEHISRAAPGLAPRVIKYGVVYDEEDDMDKPYMVSEYKFLNRLSGNATALSMLAKRLAELHSYRSSKGYGFQYATYCGATRTQGQWFKDWPSCFADMIRSLLNGLRTDTQYAPLIALEPEVVNRVIPFLLGPPLEVEPILLHGDLWMGNVGVDTATQTPIIYDPASYYGHNEAELSIMRMFGGFPPAFFEEYHSHIPRSKPVTEYDMRQTLYELFHYLNHTSIFRTTTYATEAQNRMKKLIEYVRDHDGSPRE